MYFVAGGLCKKYQNRKKTNLLDLLCDTSKIQAYQHSTPLAKVPAGWLSANANLVLKETLKSERMGKNRGSEHEYSLFFMEKNGMGQHSWTQ